MTKNKNSLDRKSGIKASFKYLLALLLLFLPLFLSGQQFSFKEKKELKSVDSYPCFAEFSPFRKYFAIAWSDNRVEIYDKNWRRIYNYEGDPDTGSAKVSFSPDEEYLAFSRYKSQNDIALIRLSDLKLIQVLTGHSDKIYELTFSRGGKFLASSGKDETIRIWNKKENGMFLLQVLKDPHKGYNTHLYGGLSFSYNDLYLVSGGSNQQKTGRHQKKITIYKLANGKYEFLETHSKRSDSWYINGVDFHPSKMEIVAGHDDGLDIWTFKKDQFVMIDSVRTNNISGPSQFVTFSPTGDYVITDIGGYFHEGNKGKEARFWSLQNGHYRETQTIYRHTGTLFAGNFSDDGKFLVTCSEDKSAIIWELSDVSPSAHSMVANYLNDELTSAQKRVFTPEILKDILTHLDKDLTQPKDEFETTAHYNKRRHELAETTLSHLQKHIESEYNIVSASGGKVKMDVQGLIGYNADREIYKIRFLDTEAGVNMPVEAARQLKNAWKKAYILALKEKEKGEIAFKYGNFQLVHPLTGHQYSITPVENPFHLKSAELLTKNRNGFYGMSETSARQVVNDYKVTRGLLFATNVYDSFSDLINPVMDANSLAAELKDNYIMMLEVVENPTLNETVSKIREYASSQYNPGEQLFIFFAGHGIYDRVFKEGYVISKDSKPIDETKTSYLSHSNLRTIVNNIPCDHIFLVMDVCFGGTFDPLLASRSRAADIYEDISTEDFIERKSKYKTRLFLTSGGNEYVPDGRPGHHSPFMRKFLEAFRNYGGKDGIVTVNEILQYIEKVNPQPRFGEFGDNEPGSDFLFVVRK